MKLSFDDEETFKEAVGSLCFNNSPSDPNSTLPSQQMESVLTQDFERNKDICFKNPPSDPNLNILRRVGSTSSFIVEL